MKSVDQAVLWAFVFGLGLAGVTFAQGTSGNTDAEPRLRVETDYAVFQSGHGNSYLEIYYSLNQEGLTFVSDSDSTLSGAAVVRINLWRGDSLWAADMWKMESTIRDTSEKAIRNMVDAVRYPVSPGEYLLKLYARDLHNPANADSSLTDLSVKPIVPGEFSMSGLELATSIARSEGQREGAFYKNTLKVIPNPGNIYGDELPILYYYCEAYNLPQGITGETYRTRCQITDADGEPVELIKPKERSKPVVPSSVEVGTVNISRLPTGVYFLNLAIMDEDDRAVGESSKKFYVYNPEVDRERSKLALEQEVATSVFGGMTEPELDQEYEMLQYIVRESEKSFWQKLKGVDAKRSFLYSFWKLRDPNPETPVNEMREAYFQRVEYANKNFRSFSREGWRTDRGRVYIIYGPPDDIDYFPSSEDILPYQIWYYNEVQGGVEFVFVDREGHKEYALVHSDALGETQNPDWKSWARRIR